MVTKLSQREALVLKAETANRESRQLAFQPGYEDTPEFWCALARDVIAMANSGGGVLVFGVKADGTPTGSDGRAFLTLGVAAIAGRLAEWIGDAFAEIEVATVRRGDIDCPAVIVAGADVPIPFSKAGTWVNADGEQRTAFAEGAVYFRHGAKSAPATYADFSRWIARYASAERHRLMRGMKKIVTAAPGHVVAAVTTADPLVAGGGMIAQLSNDPKARKIIPRRVGDFYPHRGVDLRQKAGEALKGTTLNSHDLVSVNHAYRIFADHPEFATKPHDKAAPLYSDQYLDWLVEQIRNNPNFLVEARASYAAERKGG